MNFDLNRARKVSENQTVVRVTLTDGQKLVIALLDAWKENADRMGATRGWVTVEGMTDYLTETLAGDDLTEDQQAKRKEVEASLVAALNTLRKGDKGEDFKIGTCEKVQKGIKGKAPLYFHRDATAPIIGKIMKAYKDETVELAAK